MVASRAATLPVLPRAVVVLQVSPHVAAMEVKEEEEEEEEEAFARQTVDEETAKRGDTRSPTIDH